MANWHCVCILDSFSDQLKQIFTGVILGHLVASKLIMLAFLSHVSDPLSDVKNGDDAGVDVAG